MRSPTATIKVTYISGSSETFRRVLDNVATCVRWAMIPGVRAARISIKAPDGHVLIIERQS